MTSFYVQFLEGGFLQHPTVQTPEPIFTQNTSNLGVPMAKCNTLTPILRKNRILGIEFDWTCFATENRFNKGVLAYKLSLVVIVAFCLHSYLIST